LTQKHNIDKKTPKEMNFAFGIKRRRSCLLGVFKELMTLPTESSYYLKCITAFLFFRGLHRYLSCWLVTEKKKKKPTTPLLSGFFFFNVTPQVDFFPSSVSHIFPSIF
jgi:hypothetical protein